MHRARTPWHLGMPHTIARTLNEVALLGHAQDLFGFPSAGLAAFGPDDDLDVVSTLGRYGPSMLDAEHPTR